MEKKDLVESRRSFLKKAAYAVPAVVALGQITNPSDLAAGNNGNSKFVGQGSEHANPNATNNDRNDAKDIFKVR